MYWYAGYDNTFKYKFGGSISYITAQLEKLGCPEVGQSLEDVLSKMDNCQQVATAIYYNQFIQTKVGTSGSILWRIAKGAEQYKKTKGWVDKFEFLGRYVKGGVESFCKKKNIVILIIIAGMEAQVDFENNNHLGHAAFVGGKNLYKAITATDVGLLFACIAVMFSESWIIVAGLCILTTAATGKLLDTIDNWQQEKGIEDDRFGFKKTRTENIIAK
jgi:hypothetical protein